MINIYNQVPTIYSKASRDFQYLSWLINIVLNSVKHNVDDLYDLPNNRADADLTELLALTLGFKIKRNYDKEQLLTLVSIIPSILKCKGTEKAIRIAGDALIRSSGAFGNFDVKFNKQSAEIRLPKDLVDINLFIDLLPYILPAGMTCKVTRRTENDEKPVENIGININTPKAHWQKELVFKESTGEFSGLSVLHKSSVKPEFTNYDTETSNLNIGLLENTVIPVLNEPLKNN